jgi:predicted nucleic acid-binding protein
VQLVIADTGPVNYLILIGHIDVLPALFEKVILPAIGGIRNVWVGHPEVTLKTPLG